MRKGGSKIKGGNFEIEISKTLSLFLSNNQRDDLFWRSHNSGGRYTTRFKQGKDTHSQSGDITYTHPDAEMFMNIFSIECKHYKNINLWSLIKEIEGESLLSFWKQCVNDSKKSCKLPILLAKQNHKPILMCTNNTLSSLLCRIDFFPKLVSKLNDDNINIYIFDEFLKLDINKFKLIIEQIYELTKRDI